MISAKDIFFLEREMVAELNKLVYDSDLTHDEQEQVFNRMQEISEQEYEQLKNDLLQRQSNPLTKIKNGAVLKASEINIAVIQATKIEP